MKSKTYLQLVREKKKKKEEKTADKRQVFSDKRKKSNTDIGYSPCEFPGLLGSIFHLQHSGRPEYKILSRHIARKRGLPGNHDAGIYQLLSQSTHLHNLQSGVQESLQENLRIGSLNKKEITPFNPSL